MDSRQVVGQLKGTGDAINFEWEIADFLLLSAEVDEFYDSPTFFFCDSSWYLQLFPNGQKNYSSEGFIGVYLRRGELGSPVFLTYSFFVKKTDGKEAVVNEFKSTFKEKDKGWGKSAAIGRSKLIEQNSRCLPSGVLTVICSLKCDETRGIRADEVLRKAMKDCITSAEVSTETKADIGTEKLLSDLKGLFISGDESDVTVSVQGEEFRLHRAILAARTPVFNSMFKHNMKEKATGVVSIADCEAVPFRSFVHYLYTGSPDEISPKNVFSVYKIAHKYQVDGLKASCLDIMKHMLSVETFCDIVDLALKYDEEDLMEEAAEFLSKNTVDIMRTKEWQTLVKYNSIQMNELVVKALIRKENK